MISSISIHSYVSLPKGSNLFDHSDMINKSNMNLSKQCKRCKPQEDSTVFSCDTGAPHNVDMLDLIVQGHFKSTRNYESNGHTKNIMILPSGRPT